MSSLVSLTSVPAPLPAASSRAPFPVAFCSLLRAFAPSREISRSASARRLPAPTAFHPLSSLFRRASRLAAVATFALVGFIGSVSDMSACGISWGLPSTPFASGDSYRFEFWSDMLGKVKIPNVTHKDGSAFEIPLHIGFKPDSNYTSPLGYGFEFPIFDSRLVWVNARNVQMHLPNGSIEKLTYNKGKGTLTGSGWLGRYDGSKNQATLQASCNWTLNFVGNRLSSFRSPEGIVLNITRPLGGAMTLSHSGTTLVTLTPKKNTAGVVVEHSLVCRGKKMTLRMGERPAVVIQKGVAEKVKFVPSLFAIQQPDKPEETFQYKRGEMVVMGNVHRWDVASFCLLQAGAKMFEHLTIHDVPCLKTTEAGKVSISGSKGFTEVIQNVGEPLRVIEYVQHPKGDGRLPRKEYVVNSGGEEQLQKQYFYDDFGRLFSFSEATDKGVLRILRRGNIETITNEATKEQVMQKTFDEASRLTLLKTKQFEYLFQYGKDDGNVVVTRKGRDGKEITVGLNYIQHSHLLNHLSPSIYFPQPNKQK